MNFNNFTIKAQEAVQKGQEIAQAFQNQPIENIHLLKGILSVDENVIPCLLKKLDVNVDNNVVLTATPAAITSIAQSGYDPQYGARPIKRLIQKQVLNELSKMILEGTIERDSEIELDVENGRLIFRNK